MSSLPLVAGSLPAGWCPSTEQERLNKYMGISTATLSAGSGWSIHVDSTAPTADQRGNTLWLKTDSGQPIRIYKYVSGYWAAMNPIAPSNDAEGASVRIMWVGTPANLWKYDGGSGDDPSSSAPTAFTGAMWEVDTEMSARIPLGVGTLPLSTTVVGVTDTGGVDEVTLDTTEIPPHQHKMGFSSNSADGGNSEYLYNSQPDYSLATVKFDTEDGSNNGVGNGAGVAAAHDNMPPYYGVYFAKRTIRKFYTSDDD